MYRHVLVPYDAVFCSLTISLAIYHFIQVFKHRSTASFDEPALSTILVFAAFSLGVSQFAISMLKEFALSEAMCITGSLDAQFYIAWKCSVYLILINRVHLTFRSTPKYRYRAQNLLLWAVFNILWSLTNITCMSLFKQISYSPHRQLSLRCTSTIPPNVAQIYASIIVHDMVSGVVYICLFCKPLVQMRSADDSVAFKKLTLKIFLLSTTAILSTIVAVGCVARFNRHPFFTPPMIWGGPDLLITMLCVVLMYKWNNRAVECVCCCVYKVYIADKDDTERVAFREESVCSRSVPLAQRKSDRDDDDEEVICTDDVIDEEEEEESQSVPTAAFMPKITRSRTDPESIAERAGNQRHTSKRSRSYEFMHRNAELT